MYSCEFPSFTSAFSQQLEVYTPQNAQKRIDKVKQQLLYAVLVDIVVRVYILLVMCFFFGFIINALFT